MYNLRNIISNNKSKFIAMWMMCIMTIVCKGNNENRSTLPKDTIKIMPLGDSLTEQFTPGYRGFLYEMLVHAGYHVDFVGSKQGMPENGGDPDHSGYGGFTIGPGVSKGDAWGPGGKGNIYEQLIENDKILNRDVDVILLLIGVNDFFNQSEYKPGDKGAVKLEALIEKIYSIKPNVTLLVSNLMPVPWDSIGFAAKFNADLPLIVENQKAKGYKCHLVNSRNDILWNTKTDFSKGVHLSAVGYKKLAENWFKELEKILPSRYLMTKVEAPFPMKPIKEFIYPEKDFDITKYGAIAGGNVNNTEAIAKAIDACNKAGGGRVIIPKGEWLTGSIHFKSNVNLFLAENAVIRFTDNPSDYLPAVMTSWEGMECYNYSPLLYAYDCENIAITGKGMLQPKMDTWITWLTRPKPHLEALKELYTMASTNIPVKERQMAKVENQMRPHLIHFNRCKNVLLDGFKIRESPFWTIHIYMCDGGIVRNLDVQAQRHNNDGIDLEMTRNFLVEDCTFDQGDDAVVIKSGRNQDAWRLNTPTENIVIRNCKIINGHTLLGIGSEISGGVRNIYMHNCSAKEVMRFFYIKTNHRRGGFVENIYMENVKADKTRKIFEIDTDVLYQWKDLVPTYETRYTKIENIFLKNVTCKETNAIYELKGNANLPIKNIEIKNINVEKVNEFIKKAVNVENIKEENIVYTQLKSKN